MSCGAISRVKNFCILAALNIISLLPLSVARALGNFVGHLLYWTHSSVRRVTQINLAICFPQMSPAARQTLVRQSLCELGQTIFETPIVWRKPFAWVRGRIKTVHGLDMLDAQLDGSTGLLVLGPHIGNWEVAGLWLAHRAPSTTMYEPPDNPALENWIKKARQSTGATLVPTDVRGVAAVIRELKRGGLSAVLPDQQPPVASGEFADFFGKPARTMTLVHKLLQRTGSRALYIAAVRVRGGWDVYFLPPPEAIYSNDEHSCLQALNKGVENIVALEPAQYQWEYKRFRHQPSGIANPYRIS